jgi:hypothetical protein
LARFYDALRKGPAPLSHEQIAALSGEVYRTLVARFSDDPGHPDDWADVKAFSRAAREGRLVNVPRLDVKKIAEMNLASKTFGPDLTAGIAICLPCGPKD